MSALPAAVLCDMDGTLVNTEPLWIAAQRRLAAAHGVTWTDTDAHGTVGKPMPVSARQLQDSQLQDKGIALSVEEIIARLNDDVVDAIGETVPWLPGARKLLTGLSVHHVPCALVTMAYWTVARRIATGAAPAGTFGTVVAGDDVARGKPHPDSVWKRSRGDILSSLNRKPIAHKPSLAARSATAFRSGSLTPASRRWAGVSGSGSDG